MLETEHDRLESIKALGGVPVSSDAGQFCAIFDHEFAESMGAEGTVPVLTCRTSDAVKLKKGSVLRLEGGTYKVRRSEPDGTGMTRVFLEQ